MRPAGRSPRKRQSLGQAILIGALMGLSMALSLEVLRVFVGSNLHIVVPGACYRSAQLSPQKLESVVQHLHIRTVINLRGANAGEEWYDQECQVIQSLGIKKIDVKLSGYGPPEDAEMQMLIDSLDKEQGPILVHCASGSDRSGFAAALFLLLRTDTDLVEARRQLGIRYGHNPFGAASLQERLLDAYEAWLHSNGKPHSAANLRQWAREVYRYVEWQDPNPI